MGGDEMMMAHKKGEKQEDIMGGNLSYCVGV